MVIPVRNSFIRTIVLLLGFSPLWSFATDQVEPQKGAQELYGPVGVNETLAEVAINIKGDSPWHYQRWMYALYQKNPQAFFGNNINNLKLGALLMIPTEEDLEQVDLAEAFRVVKVHLYMLEQERQEKRETNDELLLRARLQRLFSSNEMMQKESGELFERISALEEQMGSVVDQVLESAESTHQPRPVERKEESTVEASFPVKAASEQPVPVENESSKGWLYLLSVVGLIYIVAFIWRRRVEATL